VVGNPVPDIHWMKDSVPLDAPEAVRAEADGHMLYIKKSRQEHSGNYTCVAQNHAGNISKSFQLDVMGNSALYYLVLLSLQLFTHSHSPMELSPS
jgi:hemicentin